MRLATSYPLMPGRPMSMSAISGRCWRCSWIACAPSDASSTAYPQSSSRVCSASRLSGLSSTIRTLRARAGDNPILYSRTGAADTTNGAVGQRHHGFLAQDGTCVHAASAIKARNGGRSPRRRSLAAAAAEDRRFAGGLDASVRAAPGVLPGARRAAQGCALLRLCRGARRPAAGPHVHGARRALRATAEPALRARTHRGDAAVPLPRALRDADVSRDRREPDDLSADGDDGPLRVALVARDPLRFPDGGGVRRGRGHPDVARPAYGAVRARHWLARGRRGDGRGECPGDGPVPREPRAAPGRARCVLDASHVRARGRATPRRPRAPRGARLVAHGDPVLPLALRPPPTRGRGKAAKPRRRCPPSRRQYDGRDAGALSRPATVRDRRLRAAAVPRLV